MVGNAREGFESKGTVLAKIARLILTLALVYAAVVCAKLTLTLR